VLLDASTPVLGQFGLFRLTVFEHAKLALEAQRLLRQSDLFGNSVRVRP
jgi:hypothetical protein